MSDLDIQDIHVDRIGIYFGRMTTGDSVRFDIPDSPMLNEVSPDQDVPDPGVAHQLAESIVALRFNRTNVVLYLVRGPDLYLYDHHSTLVRLPDYDDATLVKDLPAQVKTRIQDFLTTAHIPLTTAQNNKLANAAWSQVLRKVLRRLVDPVCTPDEILGWLMKDGNLQYVDISHDGSDFIL